MNIQQLIIELWHISRIALATQDSSRYARMQYVKRELLQSYPNVAAKWTPKQLWLEIEATIS